MDSTTFDAAPYSLLAFLAEAAKAKRTGTLRVQRGSHIQTAYLREGRVAYASSSVAEEKFEAVLKSLGLVGDKELLLAKEKKEGKESLGRTLMRLGFISNQDLYRAAVHQTQLIASSLVAQGGETLFEEGRLPDNLADLKVSAEQLLREMAQAITDRELVMGALGGEAGMLQASGVAPGLTLLPDEEELVRRLRAPSSVGTLIGGQEGGFSAAKRLYFLLLVGAVEPSSAPAPAPARAAPPAPPEPVTEAPTVAMMASPFATPQSSGGATTVRLPRESAGSGSEPTLTDHKAKFTTAEVPAPAGGEATPGGDSAKRPFVPMENLALGQAQRKVPVPTFGLDTSPGGKSPFAGAPGAKKSGGGKGWIIVLLIMAALGVAYWYFAGGPGKGMLPVELPWPGGAAGSAASAPASAPISAPASVPQPVSAPAISAPQPSAPAIQSAPLPPASAPSAPLATSAPLKPPVSAPLAAADGWTLLTRGDYPAAAQAFKAQVAGTKGYTLRSVVLCKPQESAAQKVALLPAGSPYMLLPINYNGNACYRQCYGRYATLAEAQSAKGKLPAALAGDPWTPVPYADALK